MILKSRLSLFVWLGFVLSLCFIPALARAESAAVAMPPSCGVGPFPDQAVDETVQFCAIATPPTMFVSLDGNDLNSCRSSAESCRTIQAAIKKSQNGDVILVKRGIYHEAVDFLDRQITVTSAYYWSKDSADIEETIISGNGLGTTVSIIGKQTAETQLIGFTVRDGIGTFYLETGLRHGGGVLLQDAHPRLCDLVIKENSAEVGGGVYCGCAAPLIANTIITNNSAKPLARALSQGGFGGGAYFSSTGSPETLSPRLINVAIANNQARIAGAIFLGDQTDLRMIHNTIVDNVAAEKNGGMFIGDTSSFTMNSSILWDNQPLPELGWSGATTQPTSFIDYTTILPISNPALFMGTENSDVSPLLVNYRPSPNSPVINRASLQTGIAADLGHNPRDTEPDMGAYEYLPDNSVPSQVGLQQAYTESGTLWAWMMLLCVATLSLVFGIFYRPQK